MPESYKKLFLNVFSKLKYHVIWKWGEDTMRNLPSNVMLSKWLPQQDLLGHKKCKLFLSHGGLLGIQETIYHGVPLLGFPFFGDQDWNVNEAERMGFGKKIDLKDLSEEVLLSSILEVLNNST